MKRISIAILALCVALPAFGQMYKWKDADGKWQYSDKPPPSTVKSEKLNVPANAPSAPAASEGKGGAAKDAKSGPKTAAEQEQDFRKRQADAAKAQSVSAQKQAEAKEREDNCRRSRMALASAEAGGRQSRTDEKGERVFLDDAQVAAEAARARQNIATLCK
jgi:Domain of unknown function (DUF4124)